MAKAYAEEEPAPGLLTQNSVIGLVNELSDPTRRGRLRGRLDAG